MNSAYRLFHRTGYTYQLQNLVQASTTTVSDVNTWVTTTKSNTGSPVGVVIGTSPFTSVPSCPSPTVPGACGGVRPGIRSARSTQNRADSQESEAGVEVR